MCLVRDSPEVLRLLNVYAVGLLPAPHPILCRKYQPNAHTGLWFTTFLWGVIYLQHMVRSLLRLWKKLHWAPPHSTHAAAPQLILSIWTCAGSTSVRQLCH